MLIAQPKGSQFHIVDSFSKTVQLGVGLEASGQAQPVVDDADDSGPADLRQEDRKATVCDPDAACRDRGLPPRAQRARLHPPGAPRNRLCNWKSSRPRKRRGWPSSHARRW
jgi:hypothetical protein